MNRPFVVPGRKKFLLDDGGTVYQLCHKGDGIMAVVIICGGKVGFHVFQKLLK